MGRKSTYSNALAERICARLADGESLRSVCRDDQMPALSSVMKWLDHHPAFAEQYARARACGLEAMAEDILDISDNATNDWMERHGEDAVGYVENGEAMARSKLRVDSRKWLLSKLAPKKYGDKLDMAVSGSVTVELVRFADPTKP